MRMAMRSRKAFKKVVVAANDGWRKIDERHGAARSSCNATLPESRRVSSLMGHNSMGRNWNSQPIFEDMNRRSLQSSQTWLTSRLLSACFSVV